MNDIQSICRRAVALAAPVWRWLWAPPRCAACDEALAYRAVFCAICADTVLRAEPQAGPGLDGLIAYGNYGGALAQAIGRLKYDGRTDLAPDLGALLGTVRHLLPYPVDLVVPVPLFPVRLAERGFNQSALLARSAIAHAGWSYRPLALKRCRETKRQAELSRAARRANLGGEVFSASRVVDQRSVLLIDDVTTTGATLESCARALRRRGATRVQGLVLAQREADTACPTSVPPPSSAPWLMQAWLEGR